MPGLALVTSDYYIDPFHPTFKAGTPPSLTTAEQRWYIHEILETACSDSKFVEKAYEAILLVLLAGYDPAVPAPPTPVVTSTTPNTIVVGDPDFVLHVFGTGFTATSEIFIKGVVAPTTFISESELSTPIDMALVVTPGTAVIDVRDQGVVSNGMDFTVTAPV